MELCGSTVVLWCSVRIDWPGRCWEPPFYSFSDSLREHPHYGAFWLNKLDAMKKSDMTRIHWNGEPTSDAQPADWFVFVQTHLPYTHTHKEARNAYTTSYSVLWVCVRELVWRAPCTQSTCFRRVWARWVEPAVCCKPHSEWLCYSV